jgi:flagellar assembly protein FliH
LQLNGVGIRNPAHGDVLAFEYPALAGAPPLPAWDGWENAGAAEETATEANQTTQAHESGGAAVAESLRAEFDQRLAEETRKAFETGRERGRQDGVKEGRLAEHEQQASAAATAEAQRTRQVAELISSFTQERDRYLRAVEREVVALALAVAARILRREAQMDPLLLTGAVRVALGQLSGSTKVRLLVPAAELELWTESMALIPNLPLRPLVVAGEGMHQGEVLIETEMGSVDLGIRSQLGEIERGFFDRAGGGRTQAAASPLVSV